MIDPTRIGRRGPQVRRSQVALEVALTVYALIGAALLLRLVFLALGVDDRVWAGATIYAVTDSIVWPLRLLPGAERPLLGDAALPDLTVVAAVALVPVAFLASGRSR